MAKIKIDSDPSNDYSDGRNGGLRWVARKMGISFKELLKRLRGEK